MPVRERYSPRPQSGGEGVPFSSVEEAWFWFIQAHTARIEGARVAAGLFRVPRPCEPLDIFREMERLYRAQRLLMEHVMILRYYGRRLEAPNPEYAKEMRAAVIWREAMDELEDVLVTKGIVAARPWYAEPLPVSASSASSVDRI